MILQIRLNAKNICPSILFMTLLPIMRNMSLTSIDMKLDGSPTARSHWFVRDHMALNKIKLFSAKIFGILHC